MAVHFISFRGNEYRSAVRIFGPPDFVHHDWDFRAWGDIIPGDIVIFAKGTEKQTFAKYTRDDSSYF